jgi:hypothetical protein
MLSVTRTRNAIEFVQAFYCLFISVLGIQLSEEEGWDSISWLLILPYFIFSSPCQRQCELWHPSSISFSHFNLLLWNWNLVGSINRRSSLKIAHFVLIHWRWTPSEGKKLILPLATFAKKNIKMWIPTCNV